MAQSAFANAFRPFPKLAIASLLASIVGIATPSLAGAVLNHRLQAVLMMKEPENRSNEAREILQLAQQSHAVLRRDLALRAKEQLRDPIGISVVPVDPAAEWTARLAEVADEFNARFASSREPPTGGWGAVVDLAGTFANNSVDSAKITYDGHKRLHIENACFGFIQLQVAHTDNGQKLLNAFASSTDGCVNVSLERIP